MPWAVIEIVFGLSSLMSLLISSRLLNDDLKVSRLSRERWERATKVLASFAKPSGAKGD